jgi:hypothetical protein
VCLSLSLSLSVISLSLPDQPRAFLETGSIHMLSTWQDTGCQFTATFKILWKLNGRHLQLVFMLPFKFHLLSNNTKQNHATLSYREPKFRK